jgi:hypothetical protein
MTRLDWLLVRPARHGRRRADIIRQLEEAIGTRVAASRDQLLSERAVNELVALEDRLEDLTTSTCEAVNAPVVRDDPDHLARLEDEFDARDDDLDFETWAAERADEFDCERCPFASRYSLYPVSPCEINAGPLLISLAQHPELTARVRLQMGPAEMQRLAEALRGVLRSGSIQPVEGIDARDHLEKCTIFLESWAARGFGVRPDVDADAPIQTPEGPLEVLPRPSAMVLH